MSPSPEPFAIVMILIGLLLVVDLLLQASLRRTPVPSVVVHLGLGFGLAVAESRLGWLADSGRGVIDFLGSVGVVFLLFRVGLESQAAKLLANLRSASLIWIADVSVSGLLGFAATRYGLGLELVPSLFVSVALTVTSVGVAVAVWREENALDSKRGQLLLDVAELDDISGIVLMAVLFAVAPVLHDATSESLAVSVGLTGVGVITRLALFALAIALFARFLEAPLTGILSRLEPASDRLISVVSVGLIIAAVSGVLGFSMAIGAFFGGLAFSRDPQAVKLDVYFDPLYSFFTPFFFISIGLHVDPASFGAALPIGLLLFVVAAGGKFLGAGGASLIALPPRGAAALGVSMIPRAEIAMVIMQHGTLLGAWAVSQETLAAMVVVSFLTCLAGPIGIRTQLRRASEASSDGAT